MKRVPDITPMVTQLLEAASKEYGEEHFDRAVVKVESALALARREGIRSVSLLQTQAHYLDAAKQYEAAFELICDAATIDPVNPNVCDRFIELSRRLRAMLEEASRGEPSETVPRLYTMLSTVGETDTSSHLALARHHCERGDFAAAVTLVDAVTRLQPAVSEAWALRATLAEKMGDSEGAKRFSMRSAEVRTQLSTPQTRA